MRIALIAPVAPSYVGVIESVRSLGRALEARGHTVSHVGDPRVGEVGVVGLPMDAVVTPATALAATLVRLAGVFERAAEFDLIHSWCGWPTLPLASFSGVPTLTTPLERFDDMAARLVYSRFLEAPLVSHCDAQQVMLLRGNWLGSIPPALDCDPGLVRDQPGSYLAWYGRVAADQRPDRAIDLAIELGLPIKLGGPVDEADRAWFETVLRPRLTPGGLIEWVGELTPAERGSLLGGALALVALPDQPEAFPFTAMEAMSWGTPVVARRRGAYGELIAHGINGLLVDSSRDLCEAVERVGEMDRHTVHDEIARRCAAPFAASRWERLYQRVVDAQRDVTPTDHPRAASSGWWLSPSGAG